jgi:hypothetical protein
MTPRKITKALINIIPTRRPVWLWGPPGVGKSTIIREEVAPALKLPYLDLRAVLLDPVDFRGLPALDPKTQVAKWHPPEFLPRKGKGILFLDELAQAPPLVQSACLQLCLDRRVGEYRLPDGWFIMAASNRTEDRAGAHRIISPLLNRFIHLELDTDVEDWQGWASAAGIIPEIRGFINSKTTALNNFNAESDEKACCTPRSWEFVSDVYPQLQSLGDPMILRAGISGCIGEGMAAEFLAWMELVAQMPDPMIVLKHPTTADIPTDPSLLFTLCASITDIVRRSKVNEDEKFKDLSEAATIVISRLTPEFALKVFQDLGRIDKKIIRNRAAVEWQRDHGDIILAGYEDA